MRRQGMMVVVICIAVSTLLAGVAVLMEKKRFDIYKAPKDNAGVFLIDYNDYQMTRSQKIRYTAGAAAALFVVGYVFFHNFVAVLALCSLAFAYPGLKKKELLKKRKAELNLQFKDLLYSISSSLSAGRSVEGAFKAALDDLRILYPDEDAYIVRELIHINRRVEMNDTIEAALSDFAKRAGVEDISNFVDVFVICKRTGGNLIEVIKNASSIINQKIEVKNEIEVQVAEQKISQKILNIMPFGLLILISAGSPEYIKPLYTPLGNVVMTVVLALLAASYAVGSKIMDIKV